MKRSVSLLVVLAMIVTTFAGFATLAAADQFLINFDTAFGIGSISATDTAAEKAFFYSKGEAKTAGGWFGGNFPEGTKMVYTVNDGTEYDCGTTPAEPGVQNAVKSVVADANLFLRFNMDCTQALSDTYEKDVAQTIKIYAKKPDANKILLYSFKTELTTQVSLDQTVFYEGDPITVSYKNAHGDQNDWLCIYKDPEEGQAYGDTDYTSQQYAYIDGSGTVVFNDPEKKVAGNDRNAVLTSADSGGRDIIVYNQGSISTLAPGHYHALILGGADWYDIKCEKVSFEVIAKEAVTAENGDYTVDLSKLAGTTQSFGAHGYPDLKSMNMGYNDTLPLGLFDLTGFESVEITYATDAGFKAQHSNMSVVSCFALMSANVSIGFGDAPDYQNKDKIVAKGDCVDASITNPSGGGWAQNERTVSINVADSTYIGDLVLSHFNSLGNTALVVGVKFIAKTEAVGKSISTNKTTYAVGEPIKVTYTAADRANSDWLCIYEGAESTYGETGGPISVQYAYVGGNGTIVFNDINKKVAGNDRTALHSSLDKAYNETDKIFYQVQSTAEELKTLSPGTYHAVLLGGSTWYNVESEKIVFTVVEGPINVVSADEICQAGNYKLANNISGNIVIKEGTYTIDLNGFTIDGNVRLEGGNVTINDSSEEKTGVVYNGGDDVITLPDGSTAELTLNEISIKGTKNGCDGIYAKAGKVTINNCIITAPNSAVQNATSAGEMVINDGLYYSPNAALKVNNGGVITINKGVFAGLIETFLVGDAATRPEDAPTFVTGPNMIGFEEEIVIPEFGTVTATVYYIIGDVNGDDTVDGADATLLLQYLAEWDVTIDEVNADVNCDDVVDGKDVTLLLQYLADWDVAFGPQTVA